MCKENLKEKTEKCFKYSTFYFINKIHIKNNFTEYYVFNFEQRFIDV